MTSPIFPTPSRPWPLGASVDPTPLPNNFFDALSEWSRLEKRRRERLQEMFNPTTEQPDAEEILLRSPAQRAAQKAAIPTFEADATAAPKGRPAPAAPAIPSLPQATISASPAEDRGRSWLENQATATVSGLGQMGLNTLSRVASALDVVAPKPLESGMGPVFADLSRELRDRLAPPAPTPDELWAMPVEEAQQRLAQVSRRAEEYGIGSATAELAGEIAKYGGVTKLAQGVPALARTLGPKATAIAAPTALGAVEDIGTQPELSMASLLARGARATGFEGAAQTLEEQARTPYGRAAVGGVVGLLPDVGIESFSRAMQRGRGLQAAMPAVQALETPRASRLPELSMADLQTGTAEATIPQEVRSVGQFGFVKPPETYVPDLNLEREHVENIRRLTDPVLRRRTARVSEVVGGTGLFGGEASPNALYRFDRDIPDEEIRRTAAVQGLAYGQDQQLWYRTAKDSDPETTEAFVFAGPNGAPLPQATIDAIINRVRQPDILGEYGGATRDGDHLMFLNLKRYTGLTDEEFTTRINTVLDELGEPYQIQPFAGPFYAEHLDGPTAYIAALQGRPDAIRAARNALVDAAPEYERYAARTGADVAETRARIDATLAALDQQATAVTRPFETRTYSRLERAIEAAPFEKGTPQQWKAALSKNVAAGEREYTGIDDFLATTDAKTLTKAEVRNVFEQGRILLDEVQYGESRVPKAQIEAANKRVANALLDYRDAYNRFYDDLLSADPVHQGLLKQLDDVSQQIKALPRSEYEQISRQGTATSERGKALLQQSKEINRQLIDTRARASIMRDERATSLPEFIESRNAEDALEALRTQSGQYDLYVQPGRSSNYREIVMTLDGQDVAVRPYRSQHWKDKNPLLHIRTTDRQLPNGERALFVEEIQSDWHQAGRKRGYADIRQINRLDERINELNAQYYKLEAAGDYAAADKVSDEYLRVLDEANAIRQGVANAPYKKTPEWTELALKRIIDDAVQNGYDRVVLATGEQVAESFTLRRQIKELQWSTNDEGKSFTLVADGKNVASDVPRGDLPDFVGKEVADKIFAGSETSFGGALRGEDLRMGGEGMKAFYDRMVPNTLRELGKTMGLKLELEPVTMIEGRGQNLSFRITPETDQRVRSEGFRLYSIGGQVPEALRLAVREPGTAAAIGAGVGGLTDEEDRFGGAMRGAFLGAGLATGVKVGAQQLLRARASLRASGLPQELADAYARSSGSIDFSGEAAKMLARRARGTFKQIALRALANYEDGVRELDRLGGAAEAAGMAPERSVATALDRALGSDATVARAISHGVGVERGGVLDPITREIVNEPLEDVFKVLGGKPEMNEQGLTYVVALRRLGRYDQAAAQARRWDTLAADAATQAERDMMTRPAVGMDDPALAQRLARQGEIEAERALGPRPNPDQVYGGDRALMEADRAVVDALGQRAEFPEFASRLQQYLDAVGQYMVKSGVWSPEQYAAMRESDAFYIPFKRLLENVRAAQGRPLTGAAQVGRVTPGVKAFTGSRLTLANPAEALGEYVAAAIKRADRYRVGAALIDTVNELGDTQILTRIEATDPLARAAAQAEVEQAYRALGMTEEESGTMAEVFRRVDRNNPVIFKNGPDGREYYLVNDLPTLEAIENLNPADPSGAARVAIALLSPLKRLTTAFATGYSPGFWLGINMPRDVMVGAAQNPNITLADVAAGFKESMKAIAGRSELAERVARQGAGQVSQFGGDLNAASLMRQVAPTTVGQQVRATVERGVTAPMRGLERVGRATEMPMRLAAARAAERSAAGRGVSEAGQAALSSRAYSQATVDFRRRGGSAMQRFFEQTVPFYGAAKKGGVAFARAVKNNPKTVGAVTTGVILATILEHITTGGTLGGAFSGDAAKRQEDTNRLAWERARAIRVGDFKLTLPQEMAVVSAATRVALAALERDDPFVYAQLRESMLAAIPPIYSDLARGELVAPFPVLRQVQEIAQNRSSFTRRPIVPESMTGAGVGRGVLPEQRRYPTTAPTFDVMAAAARGMGFEQASPLQAEYLTRGITGRFTPAVTALTDVVAQPISGREARGRVQEPLLRQPLNPLSSFVVQPPRRTQAEEEFYQLRNRLEMAQGTYSRLNSQYQTAVERNDAAGQERVKDEIQRLKKDPMFNVVLQNTGKRLAMKQEQNPDYKTPFDKLKTAEDLLEQVRVQQELVQEAVANNRMTQDEARRRLDRLTLQRAKIYRQAYEVLSRRTGGGQ